MLLGFLIGVHCMGAVAYFITTAVAESIAVGFGQPFGLVGKKTSKWRIALEASVWEGVLLWNWLSHVRRF